jgi:hypothetical protein
MWASTWQLRSWLLAPAKGLLPAWAAASLRATWSTCCSLCGGALSAQARPRCHRPHPACRHPPRRHCPRPNLSPSRHPPHLVHAPAPCIAGRGPAGSGPVAASTQGLPHHAQHAALPLISRPLRCLQPHRGPRVRRLPRRSRRRHPSPCHLRHWRRGLPSLPPGRLPRHVGCCPLQLRVLCPPACGLQLACKPECLAQLAGQAAHALQAGWPPGRSSATSSSVSPHAALQLLQLRHASLCRPGRPGPHYPALHPQVSRSSRCDPPEPSAAGDELI